MTNGDIKTVWRGLAVAAVASLALTACGSEKVPQAKDDTSVSTASSSPEPTEEAGPSVENAEAFVSGLFSGNPAEIQSAVDMTKQGSIARGFAVHWQAFFQAAIDGSEDIASGWTTTADGDTVETCQDDGCVTFTDFEADGDLLANFKMNDIDLKGTITVGNGKKVTLDRLGSMQFISSFTTSEALIVTYLARSGPEKIGWGGLTATYRQPDGRTMEASTGSEVSDLDPNSMVNGYVQFDHAKPGGVVTFPIWTDDLDIETEIKMPIG